MDLISRQDVIELVKNSYYNLAESIEDTWAMVADVENLPSPQPEIIRCKDCKNWAVQVKDVNGDGLGSCKFHKANFVTGEGYCYWADRREE